MSLLALCALLAENFLFLITNWDHVVNFANLVLELGAKAGKTNRSVVKLQYPKGKVSLL